MYKVTKQIHFCYGHRLLDYRGKCRHLHGHNGKVEIELASERLDGLGMVIDFDEIKNVIKEWIDQNLDHRMILNEKDPVLPLLRQMKEPFYLLPVNPTAENIARLIFDYAAKEKLPVVQVTLWETPSSFAVYSP